MDWTSCFIKAIDYIEKHLLDSLTIQDISKHAYISPFYFQKAFNVYTGYSVSEYIKSRRLYQAALDIRNTNSNIIDIAYKYGYETPEAFTKAFTRFHGITPSKVKSGESNIKIFLPLRIKISIVGGKEMDFVIEEEKELKLIGFTKRINSGDGYTECPKFWDEIGKKYFSKMNDGSLISKCIKEYQIGEYALCMEDDNHESFLYLIGGLYTGGDIPKGMEVIELPTSLWAKFKCFGPIPGALQAVNTKIWNEWIPNNKEYKISMPCDIEWYSSANTDRADYESAIWLPVVKK